MKIVNFSTSDLESGCANSVQVMKMSDALASTGHDVVLFVCSEREGDFGDDVYEKFGVSRSFSIEKIKVPKNKLWHLVYAIKGMTKLRKERPDIIYGRSFIGCMFSSIFVNTIWESHRALDSGLKTQILRFISKLPNFMGIVVITNNMREQFKKELHKVRLLVAPSGAGLFEENDIIELPGSGINVGYVGSLKRGKGIGLMVELSEHSDISIHIVGGSESDILAWKERLGERDNLFFYGHVSNEETKKYLNSFDILLAPYQRKIIPNGTKEDGEIRYMSSLKLMEYMSSGKPIIATDFPSIRETLEDGRNCILCDPEDVDEWYDAISRIASDEEFRKSIAHNAKTDFTRKYTWESRAKSIVKFCEDFRCSS